MAFRSLGPDSAHGRAVMTNITVSILLHVLSGIPLEMTTRCKEPPFLGSMHMQTSERKECIWYIPAAVDFVL